MKKIFGFLAIISFLFLFFPSPTHAVDPTLTVTPKTGSFSTPFVVRGENYPLDATTRYKLCVFKIGGNPNNDFLPLNGFGTAGPSFEYSLGGAVFAGMGGGNFEIKVFLDANLPCPIAKNTFGPTVTFSIDKEVKRPQVCESCNPAFQNIAEFQCTPGSTCTLVGVKALEDPYKCTTDTNKCLPPKTGNPAGSQPTPEPCWIMGTWGIKTALGCIPTDNPGSFVAWLLRFAIGIGGGIAFILMLVGAFQIITSGGDPEKLKAGKELITSALMGLIMIIFSLFLLKLIGVDILQIPGFGQ